MRFLLSISILFLSSFTFAQTPALKAAVAKLDKALVEKDTVVLKQLLNKDVSYGHSNGWIESKEDVINDLVSNKLIYHSIKSDSLTWNMQSDWASVRSKTKVEVTLNGNKIELNLHVLQVWWRTNKGWQLIARQSTKL